jgi:hypothetical protein
VFFIPLVPTSQVVPSRNTRELQKQLERTIAEYERQNARVSSAEVREALRLTMAGSTPDHGSARRQHVAILAALLSGLAAVLVIGLRVVAGQSGGESGDVSGSARWIALAVGGVVAALAIVLVLVRRQNRD